MNRQFNRPLVVTGFVVAAVALLSGCSRPQFVSEPNKVAEPDVVWSQEPNGPLDNDPYVQWLRGYFESYQLAVNTQDFSIAQLREHRTEEQVLNLYESFDETHSPSHLFGGPWIFEPLSVEPDGEGGAVIEVCRPAHGTYEVSRKTGEITSEPNLDDTRIDGYVIVADGPGEMHVSKIYGASPSFEGREKCTLDNAAVGVYDPLPEVRSWDDVVAPVGYEDDSRR
ncbi:hypothetical protein CLV46_0020 [Diaminobutyricimonas aerilata]|uniref:Uncharacterized protein n=1 Tax=Diaminobutyricimonas aerilata TaxID=1162967 RepID=A0A2M9CF36_9MICO|nr:hypothetical protein [Diaminobutyricimonas aerilata]PJJ70498.1 hypothetical protein CLV46_0020 [Diaminobutyricimonas aerilata]